MNNVREVEIGRPPTTEQLASWYEEHDIKPDANGVFTDLPYGPTPVEKSGIVEHVRINAQRRDIRNLQGSIYNPKTFIFVAGGPSLALHLDELREKSLDDNYDVYTSNQTCKYLLANDIKPKFHVIIDPTEKKKKDLDYDCDDITLILGLQCNPAVFEVVGKRKAFKFLAASAMDHTPSDVEVAQAAVTDDDPTLIGIGGGSMMGTRAIYLASSLGYRRIEYYGFDACVSYENGRVQCYPFNKQRAENILEVEAGNGKKFYSTIAFARQATEMVSLLDKLPGMEVVIHGESFMSNQVEIYQKHHKNAEYRFTPAYAKLNGQLHAENNKYGTFSARHAARVFMAGAQLHRKFGSCRILDYGCGKQFLSKSMDESFPTISGLTIDGYDPAIKELASDPTIADIVVCTDVMEHVEEECVYAVIKHLHDLCRHVAIIEVSTRPATKNLPDGRNAHICLHDTDWWLSWIKKYFVIIEKEQMPDAVLVVCQPIGRWMQRIEEKKQNEVH